MARLRNRIVKADFWTDPELLRWPREKRTTYQGLWAMAEDSGCLEDDPFGWKLLLWPSPVDADITVAVLEQWRDELTEAGKLVPYEAEGKRYLYLKTFHHHEHPRNPQSPNLPLPAWLQWLTGTDDTGRKRSSYVVVSATETVAPQYCAFTVPPVQSSPVLSLKPLSDDDPSDDAVGYETDPALEVFTYWCDVMGKRGDTRLDDKRLRAIKRGLAAVGLDGCKQAIDGCALSDFHMGRDPKTAGRRQNKLTLIFRDAEHWEGFIESAGEMGASQELPPPTNFEGWFD